MQCVAIVVVLLAAARSSMAGRAFPVEAENFVVDEFRKINSRLEWDPTNFLVDLSGRSALCDNVNINGAIRVERTTQDGASIGGMVDSTEGTAVDSEAVTGYLREALPNWIYTAPFRDQIQHASTFGCSVQPGCRGSRNRGRVVFACLFSPAWDSSNIRHPTAGPKPKALAFSPEQYDVAEDILGTRWDRSHFIENLSGYETDCSMLTADEWAFAIAHREVKGSGMSLVGLYGAAENVGSTEDAMVKVLRSWRKRYSARKFHKQVGCSVIPDCWGEGRGDQRAMYVVVSCLFEE